MSIPKAPIIPMKNATSNLNKFWIDLFLKYRKFRNGMHIEMIMKMFYSRL